MDRRESGREDRGALGDWAVVAEEPNQLSAEVVLEFLRRAAIPARLAPGDTISFLGPSALATRILVPRDWEHEALTALARRGEADPLPPGVTL